MSPSLLISQPALLLIFSYSLLFPSTTAFPLPFAYSLPKLPTCRTFNAQLDIASLETSDGATCTSYSYPFCTGTPTTFFSSTTTTTPETLNHEIASLFCESSETFAITDPTKADQAEEANERKDFRNELRRSVATTNRRTDKRKHGNPTQPYSESTQAGTDNVRFTPWKPPANSWPLKKSDGCGGDGPYYANGNGCIGPGRARDVGGVGILAG